MASALNCVVVTPDERVLECQVRSVQIPAHDGMMGFLPGRAPLLCQLGHGPLRITESDGRRETWFISGGFAQMRGETLTVLADEAVEATELDLDAVESELERILAYEPPTVEAADDKERRLQIERSKILLAREFAKARGRS